MAVLRESFRRSRLLCFILIDEVRSTYVERENYSGLLLLTLHSFDICGCREKLWRVMSHIGDYMINQ